MSDQDEFDGVTPDMTRAAEKRKAAILADRGETPEVDEPKAPKASKAKRQTTR
jgi:hypothetical protein